MHQPRSVEGSSYTLSIYRNVDEARISGIGVLVLGPFSFPCNISLALISLHIRSKLLPPATHFPQEASSDLLFWIHRNRIRPRPSIRLRRCAFRSIVRLATTADTASATNRAPTQRTDVICSSHSDGAAAIPWKSRRARFKPALASWVAFMRDPYEARCCGAASAGRPGTGHQKVPAGGTRRRQKRNPHTSVDPLCRGGPPFAVKRGRLR
jgi:hypothetical protein